MIIIQTSIQSGMKAAKSYVKQAGQIWDLSTYVRIHVLKIYAILLTKDASTSVECSGLS